MKPPESPGSVGVTVSPPETGGVVSVPPLPVLPLLSELEPLEDPLPEEEALFPPETGVSVLAGPRSTTLLRTL